jgi:glycosyltransferase involved in cell wall biosynthesis
MQPSGCARVAFLINELRPRGAQRVFVDDANAFARTGARVLFCTLYRDSGSPTIADELDGAIEYRCLEALGPFDVRAVTRCARLLRSRRITVLVATLNDAGIFGRWVALASRKRIRLFRREANTPGRKRRWQRALDLVCDGLAHRVLAVSEDVRREIVALAPWRASKVAVLPNAVPPVAWCSPRDHAVPRILTVGRITAQKDHLTLITALGILRRAGYPFTADIVGDGDLGRVVRDHAHRLEVSGHVVFRGLLRHDAVLGAYEAADIFVLSSRWEGCPNVVLEAMAHGLPIVATAVGGIPELVKHGESALLVPPGDPDALAAALARLLRDPALRRTIGEAARRSGSRFTAADRFRRLEELLSTPPPPAGGSTPLT